jgi:hypothetical protein
VQLILRSPTPGTQTTVPPQSNQQNQQQQGKSPTPHQQQPMFISGSATAQLVQSTGRQQMQQACNHILIVNYGNVKAGFYCVFVMSILWLYFAKLSLYHLNPKV